jgi:signal transduction histidine kinase
MTFNGRPGPPILRAPLVCGGGNVNRGRAAGGDRSAFVLAAGLVAPLVVAAAVGPVAGLVLAGGLQIFWWHAARRATWWADDAGERLQAATATIEQAQADAALQAGLTSRVHGLVARQLGLLAELEQAERDPDRLADLFRLDHLATRCRRANECRQALAGEPPARRWSHPIPLADVVRAAIAEAEDYQRVAVRLDEGLNVDGSVVADVAHLLAELIDNALAVGPGTETVVVRTHRPRGDGGPLVTVEDRGPGLTTEAMEAANRVLADPDVRPEPGSGLGHVVVARLAALRGIGVYLSPTPGGGLTAVVRLPLDVLAGDDDDLGLGTTIDVDAHAGSLVPMAGPAAAWPLRAVPITATAPMVADSLAADRVAEPLVVEP